MFEGKMSENLCGFGRRKKLIHLEVRQHLYFNVKDPKSQILAEFPGRKISKINLHAVRLCFQVYLKDRQSGQTSILIEPVVSDPINDTKSLITLVIRELSHCNALCTGRQKIILLCDKVRFCYMNICSESYLTKN